VRPLVPVLRHRHHPHGAERGNHRDIHYDPHSPIPQVHTVRQMRSPCRSCRRGAQIPKVWPSGNESARRISPYGPPLHRDDTHQEDRQTGPWFRRWSEKNPAAGGAEAGFSTGGSQRRLSPGPNRASNQHDTPKRKMVRVPLPNIVNSLIQSRCCAFTTI
jgi:hypothetical protein